MHRNELDLRIKCHDERIGGISEENLLLLARHCFLRPFTILTILYLRDLDCGWVDELGNVGL